MPAGLSVPKRGIGGSGSSTSCQLGSHAALPWHADSLFAECFTPEWLRGTLNKVGIFIVPLFRSLLGIMFLSIASLLWRGLPGRHTPLGAMLGLPFRGVGTGAAVTLGRIGTSGSSSGCLDWTIWQGRRRRKRPSLHAHDGKFWWQRLVRTWGFWGFALPYNLWGPPGDLAFLLCVDDKLGLLKPSPLPHPNHSVSDDYTAATDAADHQTALTVECPYAPGLPEYQIVAPSHLAAAVGPPAPATCTFQVYGLMRPVQTVVLQLAFPLPLDDVCEELRRDLIGMAFDYPYQLYPTIPLAEGYGSFVYAGAWLAERGLVAVVIDFRPIQGAVFVEYMYHNIQYSDLKQLADKQHVRAWSAFLAGSVQAFDQGQCYRAENGCVVRFCPPSGQNALPAWPSSIQPRLTDVRFWDAEPDVAQERPPSAVFVCGDSVCRTCFPPVDTTTSFKAAVAALFHRGPDRLTFASPEGNALHDVAWKGVACAGVVHVLTAPPAQRAHDAPCFVFVDPRPAGLPPCGTHTYRDRLSVAYLARFAGVTTVPRGFYLVAGGSRIVRGDVPVTDGMVVTIGFLPDYAEASGAVPGSATTSDDRTDSDSSSAETDPTRSTDDESVSAGQEAGSVRLGGRSRSPRRTGLFDSRTCVRTSYISAPSPYDQMCMWTQVPDVLMADEAGRPGCTPASLSYCASLDFQAAGAQSRPWFSACKLHQEPQSHNTSARQILERLRDLARPQGFPWPVLPADDPFVVRPSPERGEETMQHEGLEVFNVGVLVPGFVLEQVVVQLIAPTSVEECLAAVDYERDQIQRRLFPALTPVSPMPSRDYGLVIALPGWAADVCVCLDLTAIDGRLFADIGPVAATRQQLLSLADLLPTAQVDVYIGTDAVPMPDNEAVALVHGTCIFYVPRHELPGPYYHIADVLLSSYYWDENPDIPVGTDDPYMCVVTEGANTGVAFDPPVPYADTAFLARRFGLVADTLCLQPAAPPIVDMSIKGRTCSGVSALSGPVLGDPGASSAEPSPAVLGLIDCRAMLQGWDLLCSSCGAVPYSDLCAGLSTFAPPHWELYLEREHVHQDSLQYDPGAVIFASYRPCSPPELEPVDMRRVHQASVEAEQSDSEAATHDSVVSAMSAPASPSGAHGRQALRVARTDDARNDRSRSPIRSLVLREDHEVTADGSIVHSVHVLQGVAFRAVFCILTAGYAPELCTLHVAGPASFAAVFSLLQRGRNQERRRYCSRLLAVEPQPVLPYVMVLAMPVWSREIHVVFDCTQYNGTAFCSCVGQSVDRETLLAIAGLAAGAPVEVYVPELLGPLAAGEVVELIQGACVSILPATGALLVVSTTDDRLADSHGWAVNPSPPIANGYWILVLSEGGPCRLMIEPERRRFLRQDLALLLGLDVATYILQPARPPLNDSFDCGVLATNAFIATTPANVAGHLHGPELQTSEPLVLFFVDARPIASSITWSSAPGGRVQEQDLLAHGNEHSPPGYETRVLGGRRDVFNRLHVGAGEVLVLVYVRQDAFGRRERWGDTDTDTDSVSDAGSSPSPRTRSAARGRRFAPRAGHAAPTPGPVTGGAASALAPNSQFSHSPAKFLDISSGSNGVIRSTLRYMLLWLLVSPRRAMHHPHSAFRVSDAARLRADGPTAIPSKGSDSLFVNTFLCSDDGLPPFVDPGSCYLARSVMASSRPVPTPCRSCLPPWLPPLDDAYLCDGPTLLEEACRCMGDQPLWDAVALVEALTEHFVCAACCGGVYMPEEAPTAALAPPAASPAAVPTISLQQYVPPTLFQSQAMELAAIVPALSGVDSSQDWLDADIRGLLTDVRVPTKWKQVFAGFRSWYRGRPPVNLHFLEIYTDGSAPGVQQEASEANEVAPCAWAFAVWAVTTDSRYLLGWAAHTATPAQTPYHLGEHDDESLTGELLALAWAYAWGIEFGSGFGVPIVFCYDSTTAGLGSFGEQKCPGPQSAVPMPLLATFTCVLRQCLCARARVGHRHVRGHSGVAANEFVDQLAKQARRTHEDFYSRCLPDWPHMLSLHPLREWAWMAHYSGPTLPALTALEAEARRLQCQPAMGVQPPRFGLREQHVAAQDVSFDFKVMTYNVLTIFDPGVQQGRKARLQDQGLMIAGKRDLIKDQLIRERIWLLGLQETRLPESCILPDKDFYMISSAATAEGQYGCALWIQTALPFAWQDRKPCRVSKENISVVDYSPRHLQVQLDTPWLRFTILVAHGPNTARGEDSAATAFWASRIEALNRRPEGSETIVLADASSMLGNIATRAVGDLDAEEENGAAPLFHNFLLSTDLAAPSTFPESHQGQSWTWTSAGPHTVRRRLDYVCIPCRWMAFGPRTYVWTDFESLQTRHDHLPVCLHLAFARPMPGHSYRQAKRVATRPQVGLTLAQRNAFSEAVAAAPAPPWYADVDSHFGDLVPLLHQAADSLVATSADSPRQPYLTAETLQLVKRRQAFRAYLQVEDCERNRRLLLVALAAFVHCRRGTVFTVAAVAIASEWLWAIDVSIARAIAHIDQLTPQIRCAVKLDRVAYLQGLVQNVTLCDIRQPKQLFMAVKKAFPQARSARRAALQPLPAVRLEDGSIAPDAAARLERWRDFFSCQEAGVELNDTDYADFFAKPDIPVPRDQGVFDVGALPTLRELEAAVHTLKHGKASGPDGLTAETLRAAPQAVTLTMYPLYLKCALALREPVEWRGGNLIALAKRVSSALECSGYRSILLASIAGKLHHKMLRQKLEPALRSFKSDLQAGTSTGVGVDAVALAVKAFRG